MSDRPPVRKHLMVPGQPRPVPSREPMSIGAVQRWVLSSLAATTILHMAAGLVLAALAVDPRSSKIGLLVLSGAFGVLAVLAARVIHQKRLLSPWLVLGVLPPLVGAWFVFGR